MIDRPRFFDKLLSPARETDWEAVYLAELPRVYNFFLYRTGDEHMAEDLTAQTFEKAWHNRARYRYGLAAFSTWLFTIARRVAVDAFRKRPPGIPLEEVRGLASDENVEISLQQRLDFERLSILLNRLPDRERELVALKYGAGLTNRHIARLSGLSESNVGTILHRVTQQLRLAWEADP